MTTGFGALPEHTLAKMLGGLLLTYFRSAHPSSRRIGLLRQYSVGPDIAQADFVIYDEDARSPLGAFELAKSVGEFRNKRDFLKDLVEEGSQQPGRFIVGVMIPESAATKEVRSWAKEHKVELVTYPD